MTFVSSSRVVAAPLKMAPNTGNSISLELSDASNLQGANLLLVLSGGASRKYMLKDILETGVRIICYSETVTAWAAELVQHWILGPINDAEGAIAATDRYLGLNPDVRFSGLLCYDEYGLILSARLAKHLKLPFLPPELVISIKDKYKFRQMCRAHGIAAPAFMCVTGAFDEKAEQKFIELGISMPVVVKPAMGAGSNFVKKVESLSELRGFLDRFYAEAAGKAQQWGLLETNWRSVLIEEYIGGSEVDIDCAVERGKVVFASISDNKPPEEPYFLERGGRCPSTLTDTHQVSFIPSLTAELLLLLKQVVGMMGPEATGCFHFEAKHCSIRGAVPIELNLRIGNAETYMMVRGAYGVNLGIEAVRASLGLPLTARNKLQAIAHCSSVNFIPSWRGWGRLDAITVDQALARNESLLGIHFYYPEGMFYHDHFFRPGTVIALPPAGYQSCGWMAVRGATAEEAEINLMRLTRYVSFKMCDPDEPGDREE